MKNDMSVLNRILKTKQEEVTERKNRISERDLMSTLLAGRQRLSMRNRQQGSLQNLNGSLLPEDLFMRQPECRRWSADMYGMVLRLVRC